MECILQNIWICNGEDIGIQADPSRWLSSRQNPTHYFPSKRLVDFSSCKTTNNRPDISLLFKRSTHNLSHFEFDSDTWVTNAPKRLIRDKYSIVVLTTGKNLGDIIRFAELTLKPVSRLHRVVVVWNIASNPIPMAVAKKLASLERVKLVVSPVNSLNSRFLLGNLHTETQAICSLDEDMIYSDIADFEKLFEAWLVDPSKLVGYYRRTLEKETANHISYTFRSNPYNIVLTGFSIYHRNYASVYSMAIPNLAISLVDTWFNCEDILMNAVIGHLAKEPVLGLHMKRSFMKRPDKSSISKGSHHRNYRSCCATYFSLLFENRIKIPDTLKVIVT